MSGSVKKMAEINIFCARQCKICPGLGPSYRLFFGVAPAKIFGKQSSERQTADYPVRSDYPVNKSDLRWAIFTQEIIIQCVRNGGGTMKVQSM